MQDSANNIATASPILELKNASVHFNEGKTKGKLAVDDVSFTVNAGDIVGIVGTSGCGKTTIARTIAGLQPLSSGEIRFQGKSTQNLSHQEKLNYKRSVQLVFQDTLGALNPRMTIEAALDEVLRVHRKHELRTHQERMAELTQLIEKVELPISVLKSYPHEISGGQRQRIGIARALAVKPTLLIADEPVSALDVSVQAQIIKMLSRLIVEEKMTMLFIAHDLAVVRCLCNKVIVMNNGRIEEAGACEDVYTNPRSEFTKTLLAAIPDININSRDRI